MSTFSEALHRARERVKKGSFREAFDSIVDLPVTRPDHLFAKIALMADVGVALRDHSILEYGLYLMEHHQREILAVPVYAPYHWLNLANLRANLLSLRESEGGERPWFDRSLSVPAREAYTNAKNAAGDDNILKALILTAHGRLLVGLGRDWEAFGLFCEATRCNPENIDARRSRTETLVSLAGTAPSLEISLLREAAEHLVRDASDDEGGGIDEGVIELGKHLVERLSPQQRSEPMDYPTKTVITDNDREHEMVMFSIKHHLYLSPCSSCRLCDRAIGDAAALGASHALVGGKRPDRYRKMATLAGRITGRYRALRIAVVEHQLGIDAPDGSDHHSHNPEVEGWREVCSATANAMLAMAGSGTLLEGMAAYVAQFLGMGHAGPMRIENILGTPKAPRSDIRQKANPALHGFWDLWADGVEGISVGADLPLLIGRSLSDEKVETLTLDGEQFTERAVGTLRWMRDLIGYLIRMADREARDQLSDPPLWPLQAFVPPPHVRMD